VGYFNLMILLSRYIFAGFGILFVAVAFSFMKPFVAYPLGTMGDKNKFLYLCLVFFHLGGVCIIVGKQPDLQIRMAVILNGLLVFCIITLTLWLLKLWHRQHEIIIWNLVFFLMDIGYLMLERLDHQLASKQILAYTIGVATALIIPSILPILLHAKNKYVYLALLSVTMVLPFLFGDKILGATNWVQIAGISIQPSEIGKIALVLFLASLFSGIKPKSQMKILGFSSVVVACALACLVLQRDLGAALLYYLTFLMMLFIATEKVILPVIGMFLGSLGAILGYFVFSHVRVRVEAWLDPWKDISGTGYQVVQGLFAIGTWGWLGSGLTRGVPNKIPFAAADYIFAAICEEFGNLIGIIILFVYLGVVLQCMQIALNQSNLFNRFVAMGIATLFTIQTFIIIGGVLKLIPLTGITSPFLSAGGSSFVVSIGMIGIMTYFSYQERIVKTKEEERRE
jgi:cell division protein FtsW (lipid II flippase)